MIKLWIHALVNIVWLGVSERFKLKDSMNTELNILFSERGTRLNKREIVLGRSTGWWECALHDIDALRAALLNCSDNKDQHCNKPRIQCSASRERALRQIFTDERNRNKDVCYLSIRWDLLSLLYSFALNDKIPNRINPLPNPPRQKWALEPHLIISSSE